jgi:hypothetical protein
MKCGSYSSQASKQSESDVELLREKLKEVRPKKD